jgi:two-component system OmpR family sensor kinase
MNRLFWRFAALVLLAITLAGRHLYHFCPAVRRPAGRNGAASGSRPDFSARAVHRSGRRDEWLPRLNKVREVSTASFELEPLAALLRLSARQRQQLLDGAIIIDVGGKVFTGAWTATATATSAARRN